MVNIKHLKAFIALASELHFTNAADQLCITQPALSTLIRQLESDLDITLVARNTRQVQLTQAGEEFLSTAQKLVNDFEDALNDIKLYKAIKRGRLVIAALPSLCTSVLPPIIKQFKNDHPGIRIEVLDISGDEVVEAVRSKSVDFGITYKHPGKDIEARALMQDELVLICDTSRKIAKNATVDWESLSKEPIIAMHKGTTIRNLIDNVANEQNIKLNIILEPKLMPSAIAYVEAGLGSAILPDSGITSQLPKTLKRIPITSPQIKREICLLKLHQMVSSPAAEKFISVLFSTLPEPSQ
ncbi:LysR family transcriptional regulator [Marinimicrobium sp. LS-A18]|uniref:LysR family transcriptional regulator n=1 Tax=Marinimicrobium sp. LS-A18 TaxID=1381596 RepID=UPI000465B160|nr:LysR family transcriptional regulator [Marinimicrobium sp. LS-A18]